MSNKKMYDIETILKKRLNDLAKLIPGASKNSIELFINEIKKYIYDYATSVAKVYADDLKDDSIIPILEKPTSELVNLFDAYRFNQIISNNFRTNEVYLEFKDNKSIREKILNTVLLSLDNDGKTRGPELSLLAAKVFLGLGYECLPEFAMRYASYEGGLFSDKYIRYVKTYNELPYSTLTTYVLPHYFDDKFKYNVEILSEVMEDYKGIEKFYTKEEKKYSKK